MSDLSPSQRIAEQMSTRDGNTPISREREMRCVGVFPDYDRSDKLAEHQYNVSESMKFNYMTEI